LDKQLQLFGLMNKAGRLAIGDEPVTDAVEIRQARVLVLASDAGENTVRRFRRMAQEEKVAFLPLPYTKAEFGAMLGVRSVAVAAVCDIGFAAKLLALQQETHPELAEAAETMQEKAERLFAEQKKKRKEQEQAAKRGHRAPPPPKPKKENSPARQSEQENEGGARYGKVYGKPSGARRKNTSIGDRRREDARRKLEETGFSGRADSGSGEHKPAYGNKPNYGGKSGYGSKPGYGNKPRYGAGQRSGAKTDSRSGFRPDGERKSFRSFDRKPAGARTEYQNKPFRGRSGRANGGNAK